MHHQRPGTASTDAVRQMALDRVTFGKLRPICWGLAVFYWVVMLAHAGVITGRERGILMALALVSSFFYAAMGRLLTRGRVPERLAHPVGLLVCAVPLVNSLT
ncbi:MAG: hypothetical protein L6Q38_18170, partial [Nitrospira sp.]|nr:hypothetical protein [Nitrospira sp.]